MDYWNDIIDKIKALVDENIECTKKISDLGSGLNMYKVDILKNKFYLKFPDNLTFNCYMLEASNYYKHSIKFFPISWREDDQVSNVKMVNQALKTLSMLAKYFFGRGKYITSELRDVVIENYDATVVYTNKGARK